MPKAKKIVGVNVYLEKRTSREYVGQLTRDHDEFIFTYADNYIFGRTSLSLGPDLPLSQKKYVSKKLFATFEDRIPSKRNPAYKEYCESVGISPLEKDPLILVSTLGSRGPSSFIFSPVFNEHFTKEQAAEFRRNLGLTIREFADIFDFSTATIHRLEIGTTSGKDALKRLELYVRFPETALYELKRNGHRINDEKRSQVLVYLENAMKSRDNTI